MTDLGRRGSRRRGRFPGRPGRRRFRALTERRLPRDLTGPPGPSAPSMGSSNTFAAGTTGVAGTTGARTSSTGSERAVALLSSAITLWDSQSEPPGIQSSVSLATTPRYFADRYETCPCARARSDPVPHHGWELVVQLPRGNVVKVSSEIPSELVAIRPAATVVLQRSTPHGRQVLMLRRNPNAVFVGGHYVFPGGAVDAADAELAADPALFRPGGAVTESDFGAPGDEGSEGGFGHASYVVAAVREAFEEAGLLLVRQLDGTWLDLADPHRMEHFGGYRKALNAGTVSFAEVLQVENLHIVARDLTYWSRWITPIGPPRRFDARFFMAELPVGHEASPDHGELVHSEWIRPNDALKRYASGDFPIIFPTIKTLQSMNEPR